MTTQVGRAVKNTALYDTHYVPCNQSDDPREWRPLDDGMFPKIGRCEEFGGSVKDLWTRFFDLQAGIGGTNGGGASLHSSSFILRFNLSALAGLGPWRGARAEGEAGGGSLERRVKVSLFLGRSKPPPAAVKLTCTCTGFYSNHRTD